MKNRLKGSISNWVESDSYKEVKAIVYGDADVYNIDGSVEEEADAIRRLAVVVTLCRVLGGDTGPRAVHK
jgi:hypothetical protein